LPGLSELGKILKEEREKRGLSLQDVNKRTKISVEVLSKIENSPEYLEKEPYAKFLVKQLIKEYGLDIKIEEPKKTVEVKEELPKKTEKKPSPAFISVITKLFKFSFASASIITIFFLSKITTKADNNLSFVEFIKNVSYSTEPVEVVSYKEVNRNGKKISDITLKANSDVWLTAYVDGKEVILKLKKGEKKKITFCKKIRFETIGNANNLKVVFDNKEVKLSQNRKILHNVFVDSDGIFINGSNIVE